MFRQEEAEKQGLEFFPSIVIMAGRFLSRARGDPHKANDCCDDQPSFVLGVCGLGRGDQADAGHPGMEGGLLQGDCHLEIDLWTKVQVQRFRSLDSFPPGRTSFRRSSQRGLEAPSLE